MSASYSIPSLQVAWSMPDPPLPSKVYFKWPSLAWGEASELEKKLSWPAGTLQVLHEAFQHQLPRSMGWEISKTARQPAFHTAARIFKRGVPMKDQPTEQKQGQYPIRFISKLSWDDLLPARHVCIIDQTVADIHQISPGPNRFFLRLNELNKTLESVAQLRLAVKASGMKATWSIVGGGILADTAAFAAALDGQVFRLIPTTLLAMVDACIGGKTGVNFSPFGKNQIGLFAFPQEVVIAADWLQTLPPREFLAGLAEAWKHAVLLGDEGLAEKVAQLDQRREDLPLYLRELISVKAEIVAKDPSEQGLRACLNLGHTLAHAIERISQLKNPQHPILLGEAVGIGLLFCIDLSHSLGYLPSAVWQAMTGQLLRSRIVPEAADLRGFLAEDDLAAKEVIDELLIGIKQDKKNLAAHASEWVLMKNWGEPLTVNGRYTIALGDEDWLRCYRTFIHRYTKKPADFH